MRDYETEQNHLRLFHRKRHGKSEGSTTEAFWPVSHGRHVNALILKALCWKYLFAEADTCQCALRNRGETQSAQTHEPSRRASPSKGDRDTVPP